MTSTLTHISAAVAGLATAAAALVAVSAPQPAAAQATASPTPSGAPSECLAPSELTLTDSTITATGAARATGSATPGSVLRVFAYSRPATTFQQVREVTVGSDGTTAFTLRPPTNTRLYAQQVGCDPSEDVVLNVRTQLSLHVVRNSTRDYTFSGRALPARTGGLIVSLYRLTDEGGQVLTSQTRADAATGTYSMRRVFTGTGRFGFVVRTGQDLQNAPGSSNVRSLLVF